MKEPKATWVSLPAVAWVLDDAPDLPAVLVGTLIAVARHADAEGRNAYPSVASIARMTRKSERQVKRDLAELQRLDLLVPGDAAVVAKLRPQYRPNVFDLPLWRTRGDMGDTSGASSSDPRGDVDVTSRGVTGDTSRGDMGGKPGVTRVSPEEDRNNPGKKTLEEETPPSASLRSSSRTTRDDDTPPAKINKTKTPKRNTPDAAAVLTAEADIQPEEITPFTRWLRTQYPQIRNLGHYLTACTEDGSLQARVDEARDHWEATAYEVIESFEATGANLNGDRDTLFQAASEAARSGYDSTAIIHAAADAQNAMSAKVGAVAAWSLALAGLNKSRTEAA